MRNWSPERIAGAAGARLVAVPATTGGPQRATIDSRDAGPGTLFCGLPGTHAHGGTFARQALAAGAWGVLTTPELAGAALGGPPGALLASDDPLAALQRLANAWRRDLGAAVIGVTGSTGKTSTKNLMYALLAPQRRTCASRANFNTEIGMPLEILAAPPGTEVLVLEMAMRGRGQIAELAAIAQPDVGVIVNVGPVHLELLGAVEAVAAAKAELIAGLTPGATAIVPAGETLLAPYRRDDLHTVSFGDGGEVRLIGGDDTHVEIELDGERVTLEVSFTQAHLRHDLLAAAAATKAVGVTPSGRVELEPASGRGRRYALPGAVTLIDDCYNANPMSMRVALDDLADVARRTRARRRVAVLGDMLELGPRELEFHAELGAQATAAGVDLLLSVGPLAAAIAQRFGGEHLHASDAAQAAALAAELLRAGDVVLVKGSRGVRLEHVCEALRTGAGGTAT